MDTPDNVVDLQAHREEGEKRGLKELRDTLSDVLESGAASDAILLFKDAEDGSWKMILTSGQKVNEIVGALQVASFSVLNY